MNKKRYNVVKVLKVLAVPLVLIISFFLISLNKDQPAPENVSVAGQENVASTNALDETTSTPIVEVVQPSRGVPLDTSISPSKKAKSQPQEGAQLSDAYELIELAGQGEIDAGFDFLREFGKCKDINLLEERTNNLSRLGEKVAEDAGVPTPESVSKMAWQNRVKDESAECLHFLGGEDGQMDRMVDQVVNRLRSGADDGNTYLRFLYSMWGPNDATSIRMVSGVSEYERLAGEYTNSNLEDDAPLALLALGISYSEGKFFTPLRLPLGRSYLWAAAICGIEQPLVDNLLGKYAAVLSVSEQFGLTTVIDELLVKETALEIAASVCPIQL